MNHIRNNSVKLNPTLALKLMRRMGHKINDRKREIPESKWKTDPIILELKIHREKSERVFLKHTSQMTVHELHAMRTDKSLSS